MPRGIEGSPRETSSGVGGGARGLTAGDTIAAISTPAGEGAIALIRISGPEAIDVADQIFCGNKKPGALSSHVQQFGAIRDAGSLIDEVMISVHRAPASYTGEDLVEITCHGGVLVSARVLETCLQAGARAARAGEFTERAFLNGKMDLTQAEAVIDLIRAKTDLALRSATEQLEGRLGQQIREIRAELVALLAHHEAAIDFPEEGINPDGSEKLGSRLDSVQEKISALLATANQGRILREGIRIVIFGATNAGKSSLLNRLIGHDRVIVSETHGTTRDVIEEMINLRGIPVRLFDTAGLRGSGDAVEREGMARTEKSLLQADLRLHIVDRSAPKPAPFAVVSGEGNEIVLLNKSDLPEHPDWHNVDGLRISCRTGEGLRTLEETLFARITNSRLSSENTVAINARHHGCLRRAFEFCQQARNAVERAMAPEYVAVDLKGALQAVGEIIGATDVEQILDSVFDQFCIGK